MKPQITVGLMLIILSLAGYPQSAAAERLAITGTSANIRSGPGQEHPVIWKAEQNYPIEVVKKTGEWIYFKDFEGDLGWVHQSVVKNIPTVITSKDQVNIRSAPGEQGQKITTIGKGIPFKVLEKKGDWVHIQHADGDKGWVHHSLVW